MLADGRTWFLLADGRRARLLVEERRGAALSERGDWALTISEDDMYDVQDRPPRSFDRVGAGRHAMDGGRNLHEAEEGKFLKRIAERIVRAQKDKQFDHLVLAAPPRALGTLRENLPDAVLQRIKAETPKDLLDEDAPALRARLTDLLQGAA